MRRRSNHPLVRSTRGRRTGALCLVVAIAGSVLAGCGGSTPTTKQVDADSLVDVTPAATGEVDKVTWGLGRGEPTSIDPARAGDYSPNTVTENLCESLLQLQPDFSIEPGLATAYTQPNPTTVVFTIRSGVTFWDGNPLTADDVAYSLNRNLDPQLASVNAAVFLAVSSIVATGPLEVTVTFSRPDSQFLSSIAGVAGDISERSVVEKLGAAYGTPSGGVMCTGPFAFEKWIAGDRIVVTRNDSYWGTKAKAKEFDFVFVNDDSTLTSALLAGEIDGAYEVPVGSLNAFRSSGSGTLYLGPSTESLSLGPVSATGPAADPRVREAIDLSLDKPAIISNLLKGTGTLLKTFTPPLVWNGSPAKAVYDAGYAALPDTSTVDLAKATDLVKDAGATGKTLKLAIVSGDQLSQQIAVLTQDAVAKIGMKIEIQQLQPTSFSELFYDPSKRESIDLIVAAGYIEVPGAMYYAPAFTLEQGPFNWTGYTDPTVTTNIQAASVATDPQEAAKAFVAAQAVFAPARLQISLALLYERLYMNERITGAPASFAYISSPWAAAVGSAG